MPRVTRKPKPVKPQLLWFVIGIDGKILHMTECPEGYRHLEEHGYQIVRLLVSEPRSTKGK